MTRLAVLAAAATAATAVVGCAHQRAEPVTQSTETMLHGAAPTGSRREPELRQTGSNTIVIQTPPPGFTTTGPR